MGLQLSHGEGRTMDDDARAHIEGEISHIKWQCGLIGLPKTVRVPKYPGLKCLRTDSHSPQT